MPRRRLLTFAGLAGFVVLVACCFFAANFATRNAPRPTAAAVAPPTDPPAPATPTVFVTATSVFAAETATPIAVEPSDRYLQLARAGMTIPVTRDTPPPPDAWSASWIQEGDVSLKMPLTVGLSNDQTVRQGKRMMAQVVAALFTQAPELQRVNVIGTLPDGVDGAELPAISIVVMREGFAAWDGVAENLPGWQVSPRLK